MLTYSQRGTFAKRGAASIEATVAAAKVEVKRVADERWEALKVAGAFRNAPVPFTAEQLAAAVLVRTSVGWHRVARINAKSVTVYTHYSWTDRHALDKILEVR